MADFNDHISQAKHNLKFLSGINMSHNEFFDWEVTVSYYTAVHLINAHISKKSNLHFRTHSDSKMAINPFGSLANTKVPENIYKSYIKLELLSRRARYLIKDVENAIPDNSAHFTYDKHFSKAIRHLDILITYFSKEYSITFPVIDIFCITLVNDLQLSNFKALSKLSKEVF